MISITNECPKCGCLHCFVEKTYKSEFVWNNKTKVRVRRRRRCRACRTSFMTVESIEVEKNIPEDIPKSEMQPPPKKYADPDARDDKPQNPFLPKT